MGEFRASFAVTRESHSFCWMTKRYCLVIRNEEMYILNDVAAFIWCHIEEQQTLKEICADLIEVRRDRRRCAEICR